MTVVYVKHIKMLKLANIAKCLYRVGTIGCFFVIRTCVYKFTWKNLDTKICYDKIKTYLQVVKSI
jgi:hypothetical protein